MEFICQKCGEEAPDYAIHDGGIYHDRCLASGIGDADKVAVLVVIVAAIFIGCQVLLALA